MVLTYRYRLKDATVGKHLDRRVKAIHAKITNTRRHAGEIPVLYGGEDVNRSESRNEHGWPVR
jgi:Cu/Zn superoxide dismutase